MKKFTLLFLATILTFFISSCSKTEEVAPATIVGKWNTIEFGGITNTKTYKVAAGTVVKSGSASTISIEPSVYEFKEDGTATIGKATGTYKLANSKLVFTSKDGAFNYDVTSLTNTELKLSCLKLTKKATEDYDLISNELIVSYLYGAYAMLGNGGTETDLDNSTSLQGTILLKK